MTRTHLHRNHGCRTHGFIGVLTLVVVLAACGETDRASTIQSARTPADRVALIRTTTGVAGVLEGTANVVWSLDRAVAAADGSAVFSTEIDGTLTRNDPWTGDALDSWPIGLGLTPVVVAPGGDRVVVSDRPAGYDSVAAARERTHLGVRNGKTGEVMHDLEVAADIEPEAFSLDATQLFVLDHRGDHYRVQTLDLPSGERADVIGNDKKPAEDMRGRPIHGVLSADGSLLSTLYINPENPDEPAFVHVLNLEGWSYCVDLPAEFAQGPTRSQSIERTDSDHIIVRAPAIDRAARIDLDATALGAGTAVTLDPTAGVPADAPYRAVTNFVALITVRAAP